MNEFGRSPATLLNRGSTETAKNALDRWPTLNAISLRKIYKRSNVPKYSTEIQTKHQEWNFVIKVNFARHKHGKSRF